MHQRKTGTSDAWHYTMTLTETSSWREADQTQKRELLEDLAERVMGQAIEQGRSRFVIHDMDGGVVATGKLKPGDITEMLDLYRSQDRSN